MSNLIIETTQQLWQNGRRTRKASGGWLSSNAVCCQHNGQNADRRGRGGLLVTGDSVSYSCFNCNFKTGYSIGYTLGPRFKSLLEWIGADSVTIDKLSAEAIKVAAEVSGNAARAKAATTVTFNESQLPPGSERVDPANPLHQVHVDYIKSRGLTTDSYDFYCTPEAEGRNRNRLIIPYYYRDKLVGNTSRFYDDRKPKYIQESQRGYVFNLPAQRREWNTCILVEGQFDALSIGGCAYMGSTINNEQAILINRLRRRIIVVPDRDSAGMAITDRALELGYQVSIPLWDSGVKDVNDAVLRYGKFPTLLSILQASTTNKIKIEMEKRKYR